MFLWWELRDHQKTDVSYPDINMWNTNMSNHDVFIAPEYVCCVPTHCLCIFKYSSPMFDTFCIFQSCEKSMAINWSTHCLLCELQYLKCTNHGQSCSEAGMPLWSHQCRMALLWDKLQCLPPCSEPVLNKNACCTIVNSTGTPSPVTWKEEELSKSIRIL